MKYLCVGIGFIHAYLYLFGVVDFGYDFFKWFTYGVMVMVWVVIGVFIKTEDDKR